MKRIFYIIMIAIILAFAAAPSHGKNLHKEAWYQRNHCKSLNGVIEYNVKGVRVDCLTKDHAIEYDFDNKWYNGFSQALLYGELTGLKPMLILIDEKGKSPKYLKRFHMINKLLKNPIEIQIIFEKEF